MKIPHAENGTMRTPTFEKKISDPIFFFFFFGFLCRNFVTPMSTLANNKSASLLKKWKISAQKCVSPAIFFRQKIWHDFVTPFSTLPNIKGFLLTKSTTPDRLPCRARPPNEDFLGFWPIIVSNIAPKNSFFSRPASIVVIYTPQKKPVAGFSWPGGQYLRDKCWQTKNSILGLPASTSISNSIIVN